MKAAAARPRSKATRQRLMQALDNLLKEKAFDKITVIEIANAAGVSAGLLYAHFSNKEAFLEVLLTEYKQRIRARLSAVEAEDVSEEYRAAGGLRQALKLITAFAFEQLSEDAHIIRAISLYLRDRPASELQEWRDLRAKAAATITPVIEVYQDDVARADKKRAAEMLVYFFNTIFMEALMSRELHSSRPLAAGDHMFIEDIADFAYGYLTTR